MQLWPVLLTNLLAGGASCAAVQGGLLTGLLARRTNIAPAAICATVDRPTTAAEQSQEPQAQETACPQTACPPRCSRQSTPSPQRQNGRTRAREA